MDPMKPGMGNGPDEQQMESHLRQLLGSLTDAQVQELADMAEAMHAEGGQQQ